MRPEGALRDDAHDAAGKVLLTDDPEAEVRRLMQLAFADTGEDFDYDRDVEPWLGDRAGFWVRPTETKDNFGALLLATTDTEQAEESLRASLERGGKTVAERSHGGTDYLVNSEEVAAGIVGDFAVIAREAEYKRTIDASEGDSLAETDEYADAVDGLEDERLAHFWVDTAALIELAQEMNPRADRLSALVPLDDLPPIAGSFEADGDRLALEVKARGSKLGPLLGGGSTPLLQELPGDSWAAFGSADVGETLRETIDGFAGALGGLVVRRELQREYGLDLDRDLLDWIGHVGFFVRGRTLETLDGGVVIQVTDEERAADAFGKLVGAVQVEAKVRAEPVDIAGADQAFELSDRRAPHPIVLARGSERVVIAVGRPAAADAPRHGEARRQRAVRRPRSCSGAWSRACCSRCRRWSSWSSRVGGDRTSTKAQALPRAVRRRDGGRRRRHASDARRRASRRSRSAAGLHDASYATSRPTRSAARPAWASGSTARSRSWPRCRRSSASRRHDRRQQRRGDEQQDRGHEQQGDDELDLRPGARGRLGGVLGGARAGGARLGGKGGDERGAVAVRALERRDQRRDAGGRARAARARGRSSRAGCRAPPARRRGAARRRAGPGGAVRPRRARAPARGRPRRRRAAGRARPPARPRSRRRGGGRAGRARRPARGSRRPARRRAA